MIVVSEFYTKCSIDVDKIITGIYKVNKYIKLVLPCTNPLVAIIH